MKPRATSGLICKDARYHKYMMLLVKMDVEWTRQRLRRGKSVASTFKGNQGAFAQACYQYAQGIQDYCDDFCKANRRFPGWKPPGNTRPADWLYHPIFYVPFGHADTMALCLLDDFEPLTYLGGEIRTTTEDLCLAFCPDLNSLGFTSGPPLQNPHEIFAGISRPAPLPKDRWEEFYPPTFPSQEQTPLVAFTHYKMDGLANLGQALLFQHALFRAMAKRIQEVNEWYHDRFDTDATVSALLEDRGSIDSSRCCLLDLQSAEEVGTLCLCNNFTMALSYVHAMRSLTYRDVFAADPSKELEGAFRESKVCQELMHRVAGNSKHLAPSEDHVFRWSHTSLGVSTSAVFEEKCQRPCRGYAEAYVQLHIPPGHQDPVEKRFQTVPSNKDKRYRGSSNYRRVQAGPGDLLCSYNHGRNDNAASLCHISGIVGLMGANLSTFGTDVSQGKGRDIIDTVTQLVIPIPRLPGKQDDHDRLAGRVGSAHITPLAKVLPEVQESLCFGLHGSGQDEIQRGIRRHLGRLSTDDLKKQMKLRGVPLALRRVIENLFLDLATVIADPFLFDSVLDLYDAFATFHTILTEHLALRDRHEESLSSYALAPDTIRQLSLFATALHNALEHRLAKAYPHGQVRDMGADFRGGLNQLVLAADAPLKCSLGLVRRFVIGGVGGRNEEPLDRYDLVGGVAHISFRPGARFQGMHFEGSNPGGEWSHLALFEVDVPHILHVPSYIGYLHEAYHMVVDTLIRKNEGDPVASDLRSLEEDPDDVASERASEIFALTMCHLFVFGNDRRSFIRTNLALFAQSETAAGVSRKEGLLQVGELLLRLFMAYDTFADKDIGALGWEQRDWAGQQRTRGDIAKRFGAFWAVVEPILWHSHTPDKAILTFQNKYCLELLHAAYRELAEERMPWLWARASEVYRRYVAQACGGSDPYEPAIEVEILAAMQEGVPLSTRIGGSASPRHGNSRRVGRGTELDPLLLICRMLQYYYRVTLDNDGRLFHLRRSGPNLHVNYSDPPLPRPWHTFQIDRAVSSLFSPVPEARAERLQRQIVLIKSFWNVSAVLRHRRLGAILKDNLKQVGNR